MIVILVKALGFLVAAIMLGIRFTPTLLAWVARMRARGSLIVAALAFCVLLAALSESIMVLVSTFVVPPWLRTISGPPAARQTE